MANDHHSIHVSNELSWQLKLNFSRCICIQGSMFLWMHGKNWSHKLHDIVSYLCYILLLRASFPIHICIPMHYSDTQLGPEKIKLKHTDIIAKAKNLLHASGPWLQFDNVKWAMPWISCWIEAKPTHHKTIIGNNLLTMTKIKLTYCFPWWSTWLVSFHLCTSYHWRVALRSPLHYQLFL